MVITNLMEINVGLIYTVTVFVILFILISQVIVPKLNNRPLFPMFRSRERNLHKTLSYLEQERVNQQLQQEIVEKIQDLTEPNPNPPIITVSTKGKNK